MLKLRRVSRRDLPWTIVILCVIANPGFGFRRSTKRLTKVDEKADDGRGKHRRRSTKRSPKVDEQVDEEAILKLFASYALAVLKRLRLAAESLAHICTYRFAPPHVCTYDFVHELFSSFILKLSSSYSRAILELFSSHPRKWSTSRSTKAEEMTMKVGEKVDEA